MQEVIPVKRRTPYSLVEVKDVVVDKIVGGHAGQRCVVGVDVAKHELVACLYWPDRSFDRPWRVASPDDIGLLLEKLQALAAQAPVVVAMESSGTYGDVLRQACTDAGLAVQRVSAKAVKDHAETFDGVPSQHDGKDAAVIAELCWLGKGSSWAWQERPEADQAVRYWVRKLDTAQRIKQMYGGKLEALLARHWPEIGNLLARTGATLPGMLARWGDPRQLAGDPAAAQALADLGGPYLRATKIARVIAAAHRTLGVRMNPWQVRELRETAAALLRKRRVIAGCKRELRRLTAGHAGIQAQKPAVGLMTACVLWMCLGDVKNYGSAGAYRKAMGLNLKERSSGLYKGRLSLSKRGQRLVRKWMYFSALRWMKDPRVQRWTQRKKQRDGGRGSKAVVGVMRRLALAGWHVGWGAAFDAGRLFPGVKNAAATPAAAGAAPEGKPSRNAPGLEI